MRHPLLRFWLRFLWALLLSLFGISLGAKGQDLTGQVIASQFGEYKVADEGNGFAFQPEHCQVSGGGKNFAAFATGVPVKVWDPLPSHSEVATSVTAFVTGSYCSVSLSGLTYAHPASFYLTSGTGGLQEAINYSQVYGTANTIVLNQEWYALIQPRSAGTVISTVQGTAALGLVDVTTWPYTWYQWNGTQYVQVSIVPAGGITGSLTAQHVVVATGAGSVGNSAATDNGTTLTYPGSGGIATPQYTFGSIPLGVYGILSSTDNLGPYASLRLFGTGSGQGTTVDATGVYTPQVLATYVQGGNGLFSGDLTIGELQNGTPDVPIVVNQNGGNPLAVQITAGLEVDGALKLSNGYGITGQVATSAGPGEPAAWGTFSPSGAAGGALTGTYPNPNLSTSAVTAAVASQTITPAVVTAGMLNGQVHVAGVNGAGIGVAQSAWSSTTAYPQCSAVSYSGANYLAVAASTNVTPGTNSAIWYPVQDANTPTQGDCAFYLAASQVSGTTGAALYLPPGTTLTNIGWLEPTVTVAGYPSVNIFGAGKSASTLQLNASLVGPGVAPLQLPNSGVANAFASFVWSDFTINANFLANAVVNIYGAQQFQLKNLALLNAADGSDHYLEFGHPATANHTLAWTFGADLENIDLSTYHSSGSGAQVTVSVTGGVPTFTVVSGGTGYTAAYLNLILSGSGASADVPCSSRGTDTFTVSGGVITAITSTATGCASTLYASVFGGQNVSYGVRFNDATDSKLISGITDSGVGSVAGFYMAGASSALTAYKLHPISTVVGVQDSGNNNFFATQVDTVFRYGFDFEGSGNTENVYGTLFEWGNQNQLGSSDYHFGTIGNTPVSSPYAINIFGDACGSTAGFNGYSHLLSSAGSVDGGGAALPTFVHLRETNYCSQTSANANAANYLGRTFALSNGDFGNVWQFGLGQGSNVTNTVTNPFGSGASTGQYTWAFSNPTAATSTQNYASPLIENLGTYWNGSASVPFGLSQQLTFATGSNPQATYSFSQVGTAPTGGVQVTFPGSTLVLPAGSTATTQSAGDISTKVATDAFVAADVPANTATFTHAQTAPDFWPQSVSVGPYASYFDDFFTTNGITYQPIGSPTGASCGTSTTYLDNTSPGNLSVISGTGGSGTGEDCVGAGGAFYLFDAATAPAWTWETRVLVPVLPGTTAGSYQAGMAHTWSASPWSGGIGFYLSSANGTANDWYCEYGSSPTLTDSTIAATASTWTRLSMVDDGTYVHWYINGTEATACRTAVGSMPTAAISSAWTSVAGSATSVTMAIDYVAFHEAVSR